MRENTKDFLPLIMFLLFAFFICILWLSIRLFEKKSPKAPFVSMAVCLMLAFALGAIHDNSQYESENVQETKTDSRTPESIGDYKSENQESSNQVLEGEPKSTMTEEEFKGLCSEFVYSHVGKDSIGKYVYKDLCSWSTKEEKYDFVCAGEEDYIKNIGGIQRTYRVYGIIDCRYDKSFPISWVDVIRVYGIVDDVFYNYGNGLYAPIIKIYYIEYIGEVGKEPDERPMEEIGEERRLQTEKRQKDIDYKNSLNTDYDGTTKNVEDMDSLDLDEFISKCDEMDYKNLTEATDLTGRYIKIHVQTSSHMRFKLERGKENRVGEWADSSKVQDDVWYCRLYNEQSENYTYAASHYHTLYFLNAENIKPGELKKGENIIVYGQIIKFNHINDVDLEVLVRYFEKE